MDPWNKWTIKIDHAFNANNKVSFLYNDNYHETAPGPEGLPGLPGVLSSTINGLTETAHVYRGTYNRVFTPTIVYTCFWRCQHHGQHSVRARVRSLPDGRTRGSA